MKRVLCLILVSVLCFVTLSGFVLAAVDFDTVSDYYFEDYAALPQDFKDLCNAYIKYFNGLGSLNLTFSDLTQLPKSWFKVLGDGAFALSPVDDVIYYLVDGQLMVSNRHGGGGGHHRAEETLPVVSSNDFKSLVDDRKNIYKYFPTGSMAVASFKNDVLYSGSEYDNVRTVSYFTFLADKNFFGFSGLHECYVVPFVMSDEKGYYFSPYCYKLSQNMTLNDGHGNSAIIDMIFSKVELTVSELSDYDYYTSQFDEESNIIWKLSDDPLLDGGSSFDFMKNYPFLVLDPYQNETILHYCNYFDYVKHSVSTQYGFSHYFKFFNGFFTSSSGVSSLNVLSQFPFGNYRFYMPVDEVPFDFGFYVSTSPILMNGFAADIDTQRIPDNYYITVGGDTIYNYTITDPATGQSDTVNNYVTNNYTFVDTGDEGGSSGSVGGNVTVGGQIDVSGKVDVGVDVNVNVPDININVNGGAGGSVPDTEVDTNPLDEYLTSAIDDSSGVRQFFGSFFDFVPPEIVVLLGIGLTFVIMGRILGR